MKATVIALADQLRTEADAYEHLEGLRWPNGVMCPNCHGSDVYLIRPANGISRKATNGTMSERRTWNCRDCRRAKRSPQFSAISGTVFHATKAPGPRVGPGAVRHDRGEERDQRPRGRA